MVLWKDRTAPATVHAGGGGGGRVVAVVIRRVVAVVVGSVVGLVTGPLVGLVVPARLVVAVGLVVTDRLVVTLGRTVVVAPRVVSVTEIRVVSPETRVVSCRRVVVGQSGGWASGSSAQCAWLTRTQVPQLPGLVSAGRFRSPAHT